MSEIQHYIRQILPLKEDELNAIEKYFQRKSYPKKTILLREGDVCRFEAFIIKGCIKTYFIDKDGFEVILTFSTENWWISDVASFQDQKPSKMFIETIEDSELLELTPQSQIELLEKHPALEKMFRLMLQRHLSAYQERLFGNIALTAEERYDNFLKNI